MSTIKTHTFMWLLAAVVLVLLPHIARLPLWLSALCALSVFGRVLVYQGRIAAPSKLFKTACVVLVVLLTLLHFRRDVFSIDATISVLLAGLTLKLLEMQQQRDIRLVIYLCYFAVIAEFIYSQSIPIALYMALTVTVITATLLSLQQTPLQQNTVQQKPWRTFKLAALMLAQSLPLMLVGFLLVPRLSPLWSVPLSTNKSISGLSDSLNMGAIGELARSASVAFRVQFNSEPPSFKDLYWRALTLDNFNGQQWRQGFVIEPQSLSATPSQVQAWYQQIAWLGNAVDYNVIMEPSYQRWLYTLQMPQLVDVSLAMSQDYQVASRRPITQRMSYDVRSYLDFRIGDVLTTTQQRRALQLPDKGNERARRFATELRAQSANEQVYINAVLAYFRTEAFYYTLSPPVLGSDPVDEFLFDTRQGFCEHYASSFTFLMRAVGIPARVVVGYMGGEFNPYDGTLVVRQYDAHAWAEVWLPAQGWVRVDPTAAVSPARIQQGSSSVLQDQDSFLQDDAFSLIRFRESPWLNTVRLRLEMLDYAWNRFVLNYDNDSQFRLLNTLFGFLSNTKLMVVAIASVLIAIAVPACIVLRKGRRSQQSVVMHHYLRFCQSLAKQGFVRQRGETATAFLQRVAQQKPQWQESLATITQDFLQLAYAEQIPSKQSLVRFKQAIRQFRLLH
jgi:protein-glutamine gamma-glutamyltransferase